MSKCNHQIVIDHEVTRNLYCASCGKLVARYEDRPIFTTKSWTDAKGEHTEVKELINES